MISFKLNDILTRVSTVAGRLGSYARTHKLISAGVIVLLIVGIMTLSSPPETVDEYVSPEVKTFELSVEGSGNVSSENAVDLVALSSGQIAEVRVKPGDKVTRGQILASVSNRAERADLTKAQAEYDKVLNGSTPEDVAVKDASVYSAEVELQNARESLEQTIKEQSILVRNAQRALFNSTLEAVPVYEASVSPDAPTLSGTYTCTDERQYTLRVEQSDTISVSPGGYYIKANGVPQKMDECGLYVVFNEDENYVLGQWTVSIPNTRATNYSSNLNTYLNARETEEKNVVNARQSVKNAEAALLSAKSSLEQTRASSRNEDLLSAQANLQFAEAAYEDTIIRATFDGQVGRVSVTPGEFVQVGTHVVTVVAEDKIAKITLNEVDVANVYVGQQGRLTFDALPESILMGTVAEVDTVGTDDSGVITFGVKILLEGEDAQVRPGMSVTGTIVTAKKENALVIPNTSLKSEDGAYYVLIRDDANPRGETTRRVPVSIGLQNDIEVEIVEGITESDQVLYRTVDLRREPQAGGLIRPPNVD